MRKLRALFLRLGGTFKRRWSERELADELESHLQMHIEDNLRAGSSAEEARRQALIKLGGLDQTKENVRDQRGIPMFETLMQDLHYGARMLRKNPGFTAVAILTLALGIGANTAMFSVVEAVVLRPLPYKDPEQLVLIKERIPLLGALPITVCAPDVIKFQRENHVFESVAGFRFRQADLSGGAEPQRVLADRVNANLFSLLGIQPVIGRTFTADEDQPGHQLAILSYGLWASRFGLTPEVLGRTVTLDRVPYTVIGVMPRSFVFPFPAMNQGKAADMFVPLAFTKDELSDVGDNFDYSVVARLKSGVTLARANADVEGIAHSILQTYPAQVRDLVKLGAVVLPLTHQVVGKVRTLLLLLLGAVGFVLLIACANIANLFLTRTAGRQREIAVRLALGAGRLRLFRQLAAESMLLALLGAGVGLVLAAWMMQAVVGLMPANIPRVHTIGMDWPVLAFTLTLAILTGLVFGVLPTLAASHADLNSTLKEGGRSAMGSRQHQWLRSALVVGEVALSLILLVGAGLLVRSFESVLETKPGFQPDHVLTASLYLPSAKYNEDQQVRNFYRELIARLERLPGAKMAGASTDLPLEGGWNHLFTPEGYQPPPGAGLNISYHSIILGNYLQTMGIPLLRGRYFTEQDKIDSTPVLIVSESLARRYWPNQDPIGKRLKWGPPASSDPWLTIVGVVGDVKQGALDAETLPHTFEPYAQHHGGPSSLNVALRAAGNPASLASALRATVWGIDRQLAVAQLRTMDQVMSESTAPRRFNLLLLAAFATVAIVLATIGIYGVIANSVAQRTHEIGIRMALGAQHQDVMRLVVGQGARLAGAGVILGILGALAMTRSMRSFLFGVRPTDPVTFAGVVLLLGSVAILASYIPARRATKVDPMVALRHE
ncbi:MAG TPA: ABC transporter permease [Terriglobia bacterium]|nr:ABC transporter permease [Terriglobia bacterium]